MYNTIYPAYIKPYQGLNQKKIEKKTDDEKGSQSSKRADNDLQEQRRQSGNNSYFPNGEKVAIDYTRRQIGIEQVLKDFKNTVNAIGAPDEIKKEVDSYLQLIENQSQKLNPNSQIIQSNLKNASQILDEYITNTLKKPSRVVENWVEALFLQQINYKTEPKQENITEEINPAPKEEEQQAVSAQEKFAAEEPNIQNSDNEIYIPLDTQLKRMFIQAKKYVSINENEKALSSFQNVMDYAEKIGDEQACAMVHYEQARIYDDINKLNDALYNYDKAAKQSKNNNIKAKSHIYMGKIYDDYVRLEPAISHYCAAVSFSGEADNLPVQTQALSNLAQIHAEKYDKENALMFMDLSDTIADETHNSKIKAIISAKNANNCKRIRENERALKYYGKSAKNFNDIDDKENLAKNYLNAAKLMMGYGNKAKAKSLLGKAYVAVQGTGNSDLKREIIQKISLI